MYNEKNEVIRPPKVRKLLSIYVSFDMSHSCQYGLEEQTVGCWQILDMKYQN